MLDVTLCNLRVFVLVLAIGNRRSNYPTPLMVEWSSPDYPLPYMAIRSPIILRFNYRCAANIVMIPLGSRHGKITFDDTSCAQVLGVITNYWDMIQRKKISIVVGGGHSPEAEASDAHIEVDTTKQAHQHLIAEFPDSKFRPPPIER